MQTNLRKDLIIEALNKIYAKDSFSVELMQDGYYINFKDNPSLTDEEITIIYNGYIYTDLTTSIIQKVYTLLYSESDYSIYDNISNNYIVIIYNNGIKPRRNEKDIINLINNNTVSYLDINTILKGLNYTYPENNYVLHSHISDNFIVIDFGTNSILTDEEIKSKAELFKQEKLNDWTEIKTKRNHLLADSDWTQLNDVQLSTEKKAEWVIYRQALRDLPENFDNPSSVIFPIKPE